MAVPKKKVSRSRRGQRRSHKGPGVVGTIECAHCGEIKLPHHVCRFCGHYRDRPVMEPRQAY